MLCACILHAIHYDYVNPASLNAMLWKAHAVRQDITINFLGAFSLMAPVKDLIYFVRGIIACTVTWFCKWQLFRCFRRVPDSITWNCQRFHRDDRIEHFSNYPHAKAWYRWMFQMLQIFEGDEKNDEACRVVLKEWMKLSWTQSFQWNVVEIRLVIICTSVYHNYGHCVS